VIFYIAMLSLYYSNTWSAQAFPFMSTSLFASDGKKFYQTSIMGQDGSIDYDELRQVGIPYLTASNAWGYLTQTVAIGALISHVAIFFSADMLLAWKQARARTQPDPHYQAMQHHPVRMGLHRLPTPRSLRRTLLLHPLRPLRHRRRHQRPVQNGCRRPAPRPPLSKSLLR
jgi:hypothetical protein